MAVLAHGGCGWVKDFLEIFLFYYILISSLYYFNIIVKNINLMRFGALKSKNIK